MSKLNQIARIRAVGQHRKHVAAVADGEVVLAQYGQELLVAQRRFDFRLDPPVKSAASLPRLLELGTGAIGNLPRRLEGAIQPAGECVEHWQALGNRA